MTIPVGAASGSPAGDTVAYTASTTNANGAPIALLQFLDIAGGRVGPVIDTGHINYGATTWRPDGSRFATAGEDGSVPRLGPAYERTDHRTTRGARAHRRTRIHR